MRGSIVRKVIKNGELRYHCVARIGDKQVWRLGGSTKKEAERVLADWVAELNNGTYFKPKDILFKIFAEEWLLNYAFTRVKESTLRSYRNVLKKHILPQLGHYPLNQITPRIIQNFIASILKIGKTKKTANNHLVLLKRMFKIAIEWEFIRSNPAANIKQFQVEREEMEFLQTHEIPLLLKYAYEPFKTFFLTAVLTGMRRAEILGFQWGDIDWRNNKIYVRRSLYWLSKAEMNERDDKQRWRFITPKTKRSRRAIEMSPTLREALQIYQIKSRANESDLVFCNDRGNPIDPDNMIKREFNPLLVRAGLRKIRFHDLRHTYATIVISVDPNPKIAQYQLGHASAQTTLDTYGHAFPNDFASLGRKIDEKIFGSSNSSLTNQADLSRTKRNHADEKFSAV